VRQPRVECGLILRHAVVTGHRLGPYEVVAALSAGGMGEVYRARDTRLDRTVALKILSPELANDPAFRSRFEREARTISSLNHSHICTLHDIGRQDGVDYLVMEYLEGQTLADWIGTEAAGLKLAEALRIAIDIADALDTAHRHHVVHRDLKPGNIMLTSGGAKLLDFGLAKQPAGGYAAALSMLATRPGSGTAEGTIVGTLQYMAPEQIQGREADARTDIFALGAVIYEMVTGPQGVPGRDAGVRRGEDPRDGSGAALRGRGRIPATAGSHGHALSRQGAGRSLAVGARRAVRAPVGAGGRGRGPCGPGTRAGPTSVDPLGRDRRRVAAAIAWIARQPATDAHRPVVRFEASLAPNMSLED
jgi:hypothetical protein